MNSAKHTGSPRTYQPIVKHLVFLHNTRDPTTTKELPPGAPGHPLSAKETGKS